MDIRQNKKTFSFIVYLTPVPPLLKKRGGGKGIDFIAIS